MQVQCFSAPHLKTVLLDMNSITSSSIKMGPNLYIVLLTHYNDRVKLGLFNAKIRNENCRYIYRLIYQLNEQDLLCHSI